MIYFIREGIEGRIKIGYSVEPTKRLKQLQTGSSTRLHLLTVVPGDRSDETVIHTRLRRFRGEGEWFAPEPEVFAVIAELEARARSK